MFNISENQKELIKNQSNENPEIEICGIITPSDVIPCDNISKNPEKEFVISPGQIQLIKENYEIIGFYHSHINSRDFSKEDVYVSEKLNLPSVLYIQEYDEFKIYEPQGIVIPLMGRPYLIGILDCITLAEDYYDFKLNIKIPKIQHELRYTTAEQVLDNLEYYKEKYDDDNNTDLRDFYLNNGFTEVEKNKPKLHDLILLTPNRKLIKSAAETAVFVGNNQILYYFAKESGIDNYRLFYKQNTVNVLRHKLNI